MSKRAARLRCSSSLSSLLSAPTLCSLGLTPSMHTAPTITAQWLHSAERDGRTRQLQNCVREPLVLLTLRVLSPAPSKTWPQTGLTPPDTIKYGKHGDMGHLCGHRLLGENERPKAASFFPRERRT